MRELNKQKLFSRQQTYIISKQKPHTPSQEPRQKNKIEQLNKILYLEEQDPKYIKKSTNNYNKI